MKTVELISQIQTLPQSLQDEVAEFVAFLHFKQEHLKSSPTPPKPVFGSAKGMFKLAPDFDEPLEDFAAYME
jgi:hypothetical protein